MDYLKNLSVPFNQICKNHHVARMYIFGSAVKENLNDESDIDFLVRFKKFNLTEYFNNYLSLKDELQNLFQRKVDLVEEQTLKNPILIQSIERDKKLIYGRKNT